MRALEGGVERVEGGDQLRGIFVAIRRVFGQQLVEHGLQGGKLGRQVRRRFAHLFEGHGEGFFRLIGWGARQDFV